MTALYQALRNGGDHFDPVRFACQLKAAVCAGRQSDRQPRLISGTTYQATFLPDALSLRRTLRNHWVIGLTFHTQAQPQLSRPGVQVGLDLGLDPISASYISTGETHFFRPVDLRHLHKVRDSGNLTESTRLFFQHLICAPGRTNTERVIDFLQTRASVVFAERLSHRGMSTHFICKGRDLALQDFHFSALSQSLAASRIPFRHVSRSA
ncbi:hypothetical protein GCM10022631_00700 [Deinococcus rubellus]|uniref:hypothetical protein n=1 Tax=Deinococcus rubellus TaxID=1889240 RepID=UPI0031F04BCE